MALVQRTRGRVAFDGVPSTPPNGLTYIAGGTLTSPTAFIDLPMPSQYAWFRLSLNNAGADVPEADEVTVAFSSDGGSTFYGDVTHHDTYRTSLRQFQNQDGTPTDSAEIWSDSLAYPFGWPVGANLATGRHASTGDIFPGSATQFVTFNNMAWTVLPSATNLFCTHVYRGMLSMDANAQVTPTPVRMNAMRLLAYGDYGDPNAPGPRAIASGTSFMLSGFKP